MRYRQACNKIFRRSLFIDAAVCVKCVERVLSVLEARVNVCRGESLRRLDREGLRGHARCVAPRASADAASAA